jgi:hypothetical protein
MRKFLNPSRLWNTPGGPQEDWIKPHVLWLPQDQPHVLDYFVRLRGVVAHYPDLLTPIADEDLHMTIQSIHRRNSAGDRIDEEQLATAAVSIQRELTGIAPFDIQIGPPRASESAAVLDVLPEEATAELNRRVRAGALAAGLELPALERHFWGHISAGYGLQDTDTPELAARSDAFASAIGRGMRPGSRVTATLATVWLVWERQDAQRNTYTFERIHELRLGGK